MVIAAATQVGETRRESGAWKSKHSRILTAALDEFIEGGFGGANMDRIAAKARVSKVTIYNHFENKERLYRQMVDYYVTELHPGQRPPDYRAEASPKDILAQYGAALIEANTSVRAVGMIRLLRADPLLFSESQATCGKRLLPDSQSLAEYLTLERSLGRLDIPDVHVAARQFLGMLLENTVYPLLAGSPVDLSRTSVQTIVDSCVSIFLSHYSAA